MMDRLTKNSPYVSQGVSNTGMSRPPIFKTKSKDIGSSSSQSIEMNIERDPYTQSSNNQ